MSKIGKTIPSEDRHFIDPSTPPHGTICFGTKGTGLKAKFDGVWKYDALHDQWDRYEIECPHCGKKI